MKNKDKSVLIISSLNKSASEEWALRVKDHLIENRFNVTIFDTYKQFEHMIKLDYLKLAPQYFLNYFKKIIKYKLKLQKYYPLLEEMYIRSVVIKNYLDSISVSVVIYQNLEDMINFSEIKKEYVVVYTAPTIFSEEIKLNSNCDLRILSTIRKLEDKVFKEANLIIFHWFSFFKLLKKLKKNISNKLMTVSWGCQKHSRQSSFSMKPKIIYIGKLNNEWVYPKLLEKIQQKRGLTVDVFSYEIPDDRFKNLKYLGYLSNLNKISNYQFGLITVDKDRLRMNGFSAKHLLYISYGLPVLCPEWRRDKKLEPATIYYNESNFKQVIDYYSNKKMWLKKHKAALELAGKLTWDETLKDLSEQLTRLTGDFN